MTSGGDRVKRLREAGRISEAEASELLRALDEFEAARQPGRAGPAPSDGARVPALLGLKARLLDGEIGPDEFLAGVRWLALRMSAWAGLLFGLGFPLLFMLLQGSSARVFAAQALTTGPLFGIVWGGAMYLLWIRPRALSLVQLVERPERAEAATAPRGEACPLCHADNPNVRTWKSPMMLHWILNPGLALNEVVLGQRVPSRLATCRGCLTDFVTCPSCKRAIDGMHWAGKKAFGNWGGLACPHCQAPIPCLRNATAAVILFPFQMAVLLFRLLLPPRRGHPQLFCKR